eukprot:gene1855-2951_t
MAMDEKMKDLGWSERQQTSLEQTAGEEYELVSGLSGQGRWKVMEGPGLSMFSEAKWFLLKDSIQQVIDDYDQVGAEDSLESKNDDSEPESDAEDGGEGGAEREAARRLGSKLARRKARMVMLRDGLEAALDDPEALVFFTDGSKLNELGSAGFGILEATMGLAVSGRVYGWQTRGRAEMLACLVVLQATWAKAAFRRRSTYIVTDNLNVMGAVDKLMVMIESGDPDKEVHAFILKRGKNVDLMLRAKHVLQLRQRQGLMRCVKMLWVKSHVKLQNGNGKDGLPGNEQADGLAKVGSSLDKLVMVAGQVADLRLALGTEFKARGLDKRIVVARPAEAAVIKLEASTSVAVYKLRWWAVTWDWSPGRLYPFSAPKLTRKWVLGGDPMYADPAPCRMGANALKHLCKGVTGCENLLLMISDYEQRHPCKEHGGDPISVITHCQSNRAARARQEAPSPPATSL